jgi:hypothetical protein
MLFSLKRSPFKVGKVRINRFEFNYTELINIFILPNQISSIKENLLQIFVFDIKRNAIIKC